MVFVPKSIQYKIQKGRLKDLVPQSNQPTLPDGTKVGTTTKKYSKHYDSSVSTIDYVLVLILPFLFREIFLKIDLI